MYRIKKIFKKIASTNLFRKNQKRNVTLQEHYFHLSLEEVGLNSDNVKIDHHNGMCWQDKTGWVPICFPMSVFTIIEKMDNNKTNDYFFRGMITDSRKWLEKYENVYMSEYGRDSKLKYNLDINYYQSLCHSRFGLSPTGDCPWSYRFFESIICKAIPIIGDSDVDLFAAEYFHFRDSDNHYYSLDLAEKNLELLKNRHTVSNYIK